MRYKRTSKRIFRRLIMVNKTHVGCSPIGEIYAGKLCKNGIMWNRGKQNVTNEPFNAVAQSLVIKDESMEFTMGGKRYLLQVVEL